MGNKSGASSQAVPLPKGGGALQGIGETFAPDLLTGTGNLTVPLGLPPGRNGMHPSLSLGYSTGNGSGPFGLGWALSLPGVTRKTAKGVPRYRDDSPDERDTFILSGAEDLVPVAEPSPGVTRYRPRTEGLFAQIDRTRNGGQDFWRVANTNGLISTYGSAMPPGDPAVIADPAAPARIFAWKIVETVDPFGNRIEYHYHRNRDPVRGADQVYLDQIRYVDFEDQGKTRFLITVTFVYAERPDPFSDYRAGFEIRTRLRCTRIEIRTHAGQDLLQRTIELTYLDERVASGELPPDVLPRNGVSLLSLVRIVGHDGATTQAMPPLEFGYTGFAPQQQTFRPVEAVNGAMPPRSLADDDFEMVSLFGNGLPDIVQIGTAAQFWRNLGGGTYDSAQTLNEVPAGIRLSDPGVQLADMNGNGRADLLVMDRNGYFPQRFQGRWSAQDFVQYSGAPAVTFDDAELRLLDLDGDGVVDALRTGVNLELFLNDPARGWGLPAIVPRTVIEGFPDLHFSDPRVKVADMNGDNLQDLVLVDQGRIDYWPYLGHGRWGARVTMPGSPVFQDTVPLPAGTFDPRRVMLGDLDGDGVDDLVYVEPGRMTFWINQAGSGWSDPLVIDGTPQFPDPDAVRLADVLGTGFQGILWTADSSGPSAHYHFLELTGQVKPYILNRIDNHLGMQTRIGYTSSTEFYRADEANPATRWKAPLPFPVQVVKRVEVIDQIAQGKLATEYRYHHGYWDGGERELRGFGLVDQLDTETFADFHAAGSGTFLPVEQERFSPPTLTRNWFHLGDSGDEQHPRTEIDYTGEYWPGDPPFLTRPTETLQLLLDLPGSARAAAFRSLRGLPLRVELFALDGTDRQDRPYTVTESQYGIREIAPPTAVNTRQRIFFPHLAGQRTTQWERGDDPMTSLSFADDYDDFGQARRKVALAVPRSRDYRTAAAIGQPYLGTVVETQYAQRNDSRYQVDRVAAATTFEIVNDGTPPVADLYARIQDGTAQRTLIAQTFTYYDGDAFAGLPLGQLGNFGAAVRTESLVLTEDLLGNAYRMTPNAPDRPPYLAPTGQPAWTPDYPAGFRDMPPLAGYTFADGTDHRARGFFAQTSRIAYDVHVPGLPGRGLRVITRDPLGNEATMAYDEPFHLNPVQVTDSASLTTRAEYDYRLMQPRLTTDANGNRQAVAFSPLGLVTATWTMGKEGEAVGDTPDSPGNRLDYDLTAFQDRGQPAFVRSIVRQHHATDMHVPLPERNATIETEEYTDGFGRVLQTRTQAEDVTFSDAASGSGVLDPGNPASDVVGRRRSAGAPPNVVVSGWQVYDNKGRVIEQYEPFFSQGWEFGAPGDAERGQNASLFYDPRGQVVRTVNPDGSEQRTVYGTPANLADPDHFAPSPWETTIYDANDLAPLSENPEHAPLTGGAPPTHHFTASTLIVDALGRTVEVIARNGPADELRTSSTYDVRGNVLTVTDVLGRVSSRAIYDLSNHPWRIESNDGGIRRTVLDAAGNEIERRDSKGALALQRFDRLQRPVRLWARDDAAVPISLRQRIEYGDGGTRAQPTSERAAKRAANMLRQIVRYHDEAGLKAVLAVDFKGNVLESSRRVIADGPVQAIFAQGPANGWNIAPFAVDWEPKPQQTLGDREAELLEPAAYLTTTTYDALGRITLRRFPEDVEGQRRELRPVYNRAGALDQVVLDGTLFVERIAYDARGQRALVAYGNGVMTRSAYDPRTFRLTRLRSERFTRPAADTYRPAGEVVQDFSYQYDLAGNLLSILDRTAASGILNNPDAASVTDPALAQLLAGGDALLRRFEYDALYRLTSATGRENDLPSDGEPWLDSPRGTDVTRARAYTERYRYDALGNLLRLEHRTGTVNITRNYAPGDGTNRLSTLQVGANIFAYAYDACGNLRSETASRHFAWNHADQMTSFHTGIAGSEPSVYAAYLYDAAGQRVKKLVRKQGGRIEVTHVVEGVFEHHRWTGGANNHLHVLDDTKRIALRRIGPAHPDDTGPAVQYHLGDHLGSSNLVVDGDGQAVSREEFTPYGETSFGSFARKRYRFSGKERDEESGLTYHGARFYAPHLGRWLSCEPRYRTQLPRLDVARPEAGKRSAGHISGPLAAIRAPNCYDYCYGNPLALADPDGRVPVKPSGFDVFFDFAKDAYSKYSTANRAHQADEPVAQWMHAATIFLNFTPAIIISSFAMMADAGIKERKAREAAFERHKQERVRRLDAHIRGVIADNALQQNALVMKYTQDQAQRIGSLVQSIRKMEYWSDLRLFPEMTDWNNAITQRAMRDSNTYVKDERNNYTPLMGKGEKKIIKINQLFNELETVLSEGEADTNFEGGSFSEESPGYIEVQGLSYTIDAVTFQATPDTLYMNPKTLQTVSPSCVPATP